MNEKREGGKLPNFFGFLKDGPAFFLLPNIKQIGVQFFVVVIYLEEGAPVGIHQVFCIYLQHRTSRNSSNGEHEKRVYYTAAAMGFNDLPIKRLKFTGHCSSFEK